MNPIPPNFSFIARPYRFLEHLALGRALERTRLHFLSAVSHQAQALVLGDGDGRFLARLLTQNPALHADAIDTSATMLRLLHQRCNAATPDISHRLRTHHTNALTFTPPNPQIYDLVITHFFIDCLTQAELETLIARITPALSPKALWLFSDFRIPRGFKRVPAFLFVRTLYLIFRILTGLRTTRLPDHTGAFTKAGLTRIDQHHRLGGLLTTELWQLA